MKLNNGITALLISDPSPIVDCKSGDESSMSCVDDTENEIDDDEEDDDDDEDESEGEEETSGGGPKEKLAACSLCIDVG